MTRLPRMIQLMHGLAVAVFIALASFQTTAQAGQPDALDAVIEAQCASLFARLELTSPSDCQAGVPPAALEAEGSELEDDEQEPQLDIHALTRPSPTSPPLSPETDPGAGPEVCWASLPLPSSRPRGPPIG
jgi:hypothetical protein